MDYPLCALQRGWWGGENGLVFAETSWQRRGLRGTRNRDSLLLCVSLCIFLIFFIFFSFPSLFSFVFVSISPRACEAEMFAELLCGAVALVLYVNTLGADFCYDDRYLSEWMTSKRTVLYPLAGNLIGSVEKRWFTTWRKEAFHCVSIKTERCVYHYKQSAWRQVSRIGSLCSEEKLSDGNVPLLWKSLSESTVQTRACLWHVWQLPWKIIPLG